MEKILTFDCYGTLLDTSSLYNFIGNVAENHNLSKEKAIEIFSSYEDRLMYGEEFITYDKLLFEILTYCNLELNTDIFTLKYNEIIEIHKNFLPFPDVMKVLHKLKDNGYKLIILSNSTKEIMKWHLEKLENIFDGILVAEDTRCYKPNLKFFKMAEEKFNLKVKEHYHIAKGYWWDIVPATKIGWNKIWINRNRLLKGRENEKPYAMIYSLSELLNLIN